MRLEGRVFDIKDNTFRLKTEKGSLLIYGGIPSTLNHAQLAVEVELKNGRLIMKDYQPQTDRDYVLNYLQSIKGIGPKTAQKIYDQYGEKALELVKNEKFLSQWTKHKRDSSLDGYERIYGELRKYTGEKTAKKIIDFIKKNEEHFRKNPYSLLQEKGFGFKKVDPIALLYVEKNSPVRVRAFVEYYLSQKADIEGHTYLSLNEVEKAVRKETGSDQIHLPDTVETDGQRIYLRELKEKEQNISRYVEKAVDFDFTQTRQLEAEIKLTPQQEEAVERALQENLLVITGYAGTGKTTVAREIIRELEYRGLSIALLTPTGKAAKRLEEKTERFAMTIHKALANEITADVFIVDEASMIDVYLAEKLMRAAQGSKVIFLGDPAQLPPVGVGHFFRDLISSGAVPVVRLTQIMRNAGGIVRQANAVREGRFPVKQDDNFYWYSDPEKRVVQILEKAKQSGKEVQLLGGVYRGKVGVNQMNKIAQEILNPGAPEFEGYRLGDRVIHTGRNDYTDMVMNGDSGTVVDVDSTGILVKFWDGKEKYYTKPELRNLQLAYAMTVHKAQGSEWDNVAVVFDTASYPLLSRYWLYTALTRARNRCFLFADNKPVAIAVKNSAYPERKTFLKDFLNKQPAGGLKP
ncbi:AAA family ATPase [Persephonella sp.]